MGWSYRGSLLRKSPSTAERLLLVLIPLQIAERYLHVFTTAMESQGEEKCHAIAASLFLVTLSIAKRRQYQGPTIPPPPTATTASTHLTLAPGPKLPLPQSANFLPQMTSLACRKWHGISVNMIWFAMCCNVDNPAQDRHKATSVVGISCWSVRE